MVGAVGGWWAKTACGQNIIFWVGVVAVYIPIGECY